MKSKEITARDLRNRQAEVLNKVSYGKSHFIVTRHGKKEAAIISIEEYELFERALEEIEDELDVKSAKAALREAKRKGTKSLKLFAEEMGIDV